MERKRDRVCDGLPNGTVLQRLDAITGIMPRTLFLLSPCQVRGGNYSTISRIKSHLVKHGHTCLLWDVGDLDRQGNINQLLQRHKVDMLIGIHAFRTGRILKDCRLPYILILGGTDVNEFYKDEDHMKVMTMAVMRASYVICFSQSLQQRASSLWPKLPLKHMAVITQGVLTCPAPFDLRSYLAERCGVGDVDNVLVFLMVGAIRPVKNPLYLVDTFSEWHKVCRKVLYVIVGPVSDEEYYQKDFKPALERRVGVVHIPGLSFEEAHAAMTQSFALVNSSESEGMSLAILEAMQLKVPVLARNIAGNRAIVQDGHTGLVFSSPQQFQDKASQLVTDPLLRERLVSAAAEYVLLHHSVRQEETAYLNIIQQCLSCHREGSQQQTIDSS